MSLKQILQNYEFALNDKLNSTSTKNKGHIERLKEEIAKVKEEIDQCK